LVCFPPDTLVVLLAHIIVVLHVPIIVVLLAHIVIGRKKLLIGAVVNLHECESNSTR